jgi:hypothetical protein
MKRVWCHIYPACTMSTQKCCGEKFSISHYKHYRYVCVEKYPMTTGSTFQFELTLVCLVWLGAGKFTKSVLVGRLLEI